MKRFILDLVNPGGKGRWIGKVAEGFRSLAGPGAVSGPQSGDGPQSGEGVAAAGSGRDSERVPGRVSTNRDRPHREAARRPSGRIVPAGSGVQTSYTTYTPSMVVAYSVDCVRQTDADETAYWHAVRVLQLEEVWIVSRWLNGQVSYIAAPATRFSPDGEDPATPLAQALPGHRWFEDGTACLSELDDGHFAVVVARGGALQALVGTNEEARSFAAESGCRLVVPAAEAAEPWVPFRLAELRYRRQVGRIFAASGAAAALLSLVVLLGSQFWHGVLLEERALIESKSSDYTRALETQLVVTVRQPLMQHIGRINDLRGLKILFGDHAFLQRYEVKSDGSWMWQAQVPDWVNEQSLRRFASAIRLSAASNRTGALIATVQGKDAGVGDAVPQPPSGKLPGGMPSGSQAPNAADPGSSGPGISGSGSSGSRAGEGS